MSKRPRENDSEVNNKETKKRKLVQEDSELYGEYSGESDSSSESEDDSDVEREEQLHLDFQRFILAYMFEEKRFMYINELIEMVKQAIQDGDLERIFLNNLEFNLNLALREFVDNQIVQQIEDSNNIRYICVLTDDQMQRFVQGKISVNQDESDSDDENGDANLEKEENYTFGLFDRVRIVNDGIDRMTEMLKGEKLNMREKFIVAINILYYVTKSVIKVKHEKINCVLSKSNFIFYFDRTKNEIKKFFLSLPNSLNNGLNDEEKKRGFNSVSERNLFFFGEVLRGLRFVFILIKKMKDYICLIEVFSKKDRSIEKVMSRLESIMTKYQKKPAIEKFNKKHELF